MIIRPALSEWLQALQDNFIALIVFGVLGLRFYVPLNNRCNAISPFALMMGLWGAGGGSHAPPDNPKSRGK